MRQRAGFSGQWVQRPTKRPEPGPLDRQSRRGKLQGSLETCQLAYSALMSKPNLSPFFLEENIVAPLTSLGCSLEFAALSDEFARPLKEKLIELFYEYTALQRGPVGEFNADQLYRAIRAVDVELVGANAETTLHLQSEPSAWLDWFWQSGEQYYEGGGFGSRGSFASAFPNQPQLSWRLEKFAEDPYDVHYQGDARLQQSREPGLTFGLLSHQRDHSSLQFRG